MAEFVHSFFVDAGEITLRKPTVLPNRTHPSGKVGRLTHLNPSNTPSSILQAGVMGILDEPTMRYLPGPTSLSVAEGDRLDVSIWSDLCNVGGGELVHPILVSEPQFIKLIVDLIILLLYPR